MKVLFDTCVPRPLRKDLPGHDIKTTQEMGWDRLRNGELIQVAEEAFQALITSAKLEIPAESHGAEARRCCPADEPFAVGPETRSEDRARLIGIITRICR